MTHFSPEAKHLLESCGWREDRRIDVSEYERAAGHDDCQAACDFLQRFGDLEIEPEPQNGDTGLDTRLSPILQTGLISYFSPEAGRTLYHIGKCRFDFMYLLMDSDGKVYRHMEMTSQNFGGIDLYRIADSGEEAIEKLIQESLTNDDIQGEWIAHRD